MASQVFNEFSRGVMAAEFDMDTANNKWAALLMTNTDADTDNTPNTLSAMALDEHGTAVRTKLTSITVVEDDANDRAEFDAADLVWTSLANGAREIQGWLLYWDADDDGVIADDASNTPITFVEFSATVNPGGGDLTIAHDAQGILQLTAP